MLSLFYWIIVSLLTIGSLDYLLTFKHRPDISLISPTQEIVDVNRLHADLMEYAKEVVKQHRQEVQ